MSVGSTQAIARRNRRLAGLPREADPRLNWFRRKVVGPQMWIVLGSVLVLFPLGLWLQYREVRTSLIQEIAQVTQQMSNPTELTISQFNEALRSAVLNFSVSGHQIYPGALWTLLFWVVIFLLFDRLRPTPPSMKVMALGWGACGATLIALYVNTWASTLAQVTGPVDPASGVRAAIFIAPFVEEACKAIIIFLLAIGVRYRMVTPFQMISLAGLSAAGFAFTENIIYYVRQYIYAVKIYGNDPVQDMDQLMWMRGVCTCFGHPLFTSMTAVGIVMGIRAHSRVVRILAPLAGYLVAATLHMTFNGFSSFTSDASIIIVGGVVLIIMGLFWLWRQLGRQRTQIAWRLDDYVRMGWLRPNDPLIFNQIKNRLKLSFAALLRGRRVFKATITLIADITELAYLRVGMVDGLIDEPGLVRERELLIDIRARRGIALDDPQGLSVKPPTWHPIERVRSWWARRRGASRYASPAGTPTATGGNPWGAPVGAMPQARPVYPNGMYVGGSPSAQPFPAQDARIRH